MKRRQFLKQGSSLAVAGWASSVRGVMVPETLPSPVGYATIAWPQSQFDQALQTISGLGFKGVQLLGWVRDAYQGANFQMLKDRLRALELQPVALSCSGVSPDPEKSGNETAELRTHAAFFQRLGGLYLQVTDGGQPNREYSSQKIRSLVLRMNELGRLAQDFGLTLGYHPHLGTIGETREGLGRLLDATDPLYVKLIADVAHLTLGGADPAEVVRTYHERLIFLHFKDVRKEIAALARKDRDLVRGKPYYFCAIGAGAVDFLRITQALRETRFRGWIIVELDAYEPGPDGAGEGARQNKEAVERLGLSV